MRDLHLSQIRKTVRLVYYWIMLHLPAEDVEEDHRKAHDAAYYTAIRLGVSHRQAIRYADRAERSFRHQIQTHTEALI